MKQKEYSDGHVLLCLGEDTRNALIKHKVRIKTYPTAMAYSKKKPKTLLYFKNGFDLLQYSIVVKPFILRLYKIEKEILLDILLYIFPIQYFTQKDFKLLPLSGTGYNLKRLINDGYVECAIESPMGQNIGSKVYCVSEKTSKIVKDYYRYMSGEKTIGKSTSVNPFADKEATLMDKSRENLMKDLKHRLDNHPNQFKNIFF